MRQDIKKLVAATATIILVGLSSNVYAKDAQKKAKTNSPAPVTSQQSDKMKSDMDMMPGMMDGTPCMGMMGKHRMMMGMMGEGMDSGMGMGPGGMGPMMGEGMMGPCKGSMGGGIIDEMGPGGMKMMGPYAGLDKILDNAKLMEDLGLSLDQKDKIHLIVFNNKKASIRAKAEVEVAELELKDYLLNDDPDTNKLDALIDSTSSKRAEIIKLMLRSQFEIKNVLTKEQLEKFKAVKSEFKCPMMKDGMKNDDSAKSKMNMSGMKSDKKLPADKTSEEPKCHHGMSK